MLYLAEVQKKAGILGSGKAELKLLACQRGEQNWSAVPGDETVAADEASNFGAGALVMVDISGGRQVQRIQEAGRQLVGILQNFSRLQEKFKGQEEEIEQWKQSLTYQSQELNRREMEMESRREQLEQLEDDFEQLEQQRQEIEASRSEVEQLQTELSRKNQELEGAWAHLHGEMRKLEEKKEAARPAGLGEAEAAQIQSSLAQLAEALSSSDTFQPQLDGLLDLVNQQQEVLNQHWQNLEQQRSAAEQLQAEAEQKAQALQAGWQELQQAVDALADAKATLTTQQVSLSIKEAQKEFLASQQQSHTVLQEQFSQLMDVAEQGKPSVRVDVQALEEMPVDQLQSLVQDLEKDLEKVCRFVNDQEEELTLQHQAIQEIQDKIDQANDYDRLGLENELAEERDRYQMLNETLVGQRRNLQEREEVLIQHQAVLNRRQGLSAPEGADRLVDFTPVAEELNSLQQQQSEALQALESEIAELQQAINTAQADFDQRAADQGNQRQALEQQQQELQTQQVEAAELQGRIKLYGEALQPIQDVLDNIRQQLEASTGAIAQIADSRNAQVQMVSDLQQTIENVTSQQSAELAAS